MNRILLSLLMLFFLILQGCTQSEDSELNVNFCPVVPGFPLKSTFVFPIEGENRGVVDICATENVSFEKIEHAANVAAQWLDNDQDGTTDSSELVSILIENNPTLLLTADEQEEEDFGIALSRHVSNWYEFANRAQSLYAEEIDPPGARRDASGEEVNHLIVDSGWRRFSHSVSGNEVKFIDTLSNAYVEASATRPTRPFWYYDDPTCGIVNCQYSEFIYTSLAAFLGSSPDLAAGELDIPSGERQLPESKEWLETNLPAVYDLIADTPGFPNQIWPDGNYRHTNNIQHNFK